MAEGGKKMRVDDLFITEDISVLDAMRKLDETGLGVLFVAPEARGRGVGRALLAHAVEHARVRTLARQHTSAPPVTAT